MNTKLAFKQFVRMLLSGAVSTAIAIISARRFEHWWAGLIGVPIALLLCDLKQSWSAMSFSILALKNARREGIADALDRHCPWLIKAKTLLKLNVSAEDCRQVLVIISWVLPILTAALLMSCALQFVSGLYLTFDEFIITIIFFFVCVISSILSMYVNSVLDRRQRLEFPITHQLRRLEFFRKFDKSIKSADPIEDEPSEGLIRDQQGRLFSLAGFMKAMKDRLQLCGFLYMILALNLLWVLMLADTLATIFIKIISHKSVALAVGVILGFSIDYLYCPTHASQLTSMLWLVTCSLLGGTMGWLFWIGREKLAKLPLPREVLSLETSVAQ